MALKKFCAKLNCRNLCDIGQLYCSDHEYLLDQQKTDRHKQYDQQVRHKRDQRYTEFYHSSEWEKTRTTVISLYKGLDLYAYYMDHQIVSATMVHHIVELKEDWDKRLSVDNLIPLSDSTHSRMAALYKRDKQGIQERLRGLILCWNREMKG